MDITLPEIPLGVADIKRSGRDLTVVTYGRMVPRCLEAAGFVSIESRKDLTERDRFMLARRAG